MKESTLDMFKRLDGAAVANVNEPSPGDLARVLEHNFHYRNALEAISKIKGSSDKIECLTIIEWAANHAEWALKALAHEATDG